MLEEGMLEQLLEVFKSEAEEHIQRITQMMLQLEKGEAGEEALEELFREAHSLKGAARAVELERISETAHLIETIFSKIKSKELSLSDEIVELVYEGLDGIAQMLERGEEGFDLEGYASKVNGVLSGSSSEDAEERSITPSPKAEEPKPRPISERMMKVDVSKLDLLMERVGELVTLRVTVEERVKEAIRILRSFERIYRSIDCGLRDEFKEAISELRRFIFNLRADCFDISSLTKEIEEGVKSLRLQPVSFLFNSFDRMVRDLAKREGKKVRFEKAGMETELDRKILEELREPMAHLISNAIHHGIETPEERKKAGKPEEGVVKVAARSQGDKVLIEVEDDGRGIDLEKVRESALRSGIISREAAEEMGDEELLRLIFKQGVSTAEEVTEISGRGVGLNAVWDKVEKLKGSVAVENRPGKGCKFTLCLPMTIVTTKVLVVKVGGAMFGIPASFVERTLLVKPEEVRRLDGRTVILYEDKAIELVPLAWLLEMGEPEIEEEEFKAVIISSGSRSVGLAVDDLMREEEVVVQGFERPLLRVRNVLGAAISADGRIITVLNPGDLVRSALKRRPSFKGKPEKPEPKTILVVEDSVTTRTLERNILESFGYNVLVARDGAEAKEILQAVNCDLVVSDIQMPNVDGFELTAWIKNHPNLKHIPVILVTSLESEEDKKKGLEVGADAYIVKSGFDHEKLLETIKRLI
ncbi:hypothetical protein DRP77_01580 [Candidatus Poribacteria bacterium]|nr:MAG: hypothetical protein DRP77_01580 [Candidatus Poribacteria bacterium]